MKTKFECHQEKSVSRNTRTDTLAWNHTTTGNRQLVFELAKQSGEAMRDLNERRAAAMVKLQGLEKAFAKPIEASPIAKAT
ncbi:unnamed protein product [Angiostrongylus costaricensis]|uniref:DUF1508 domain-containing protein n=1 Tax=Angiostrongylus costaricensis TaxID=334426 RepID=A0A0R3PCK9_ANGCS|nr:unnamed protein product [Angiostrongylus costaricensis]